MLAEWQEFDGGQIGERYLRTRVTLSIDGGFYFGRKAFEALGMPEAVKLYFDVGGNRIGVKPVPTAKFGSSVRQGRNVKRFVPSVKLSGRNARWSAPTANSASSLCGATHRRRAVTTAAAAVTRMTMTKS